MSDRDELLARADTEIDELRHLYRFCRTSDGSPLHVWRLIELVVALRAALADLIMSKEESRYCWVCRDVHAGDDPTPPVRPHSDAVAGSATPEEENDPRYCYGCNSIHDEDDPAEPIRPGPVAGSATPTLAAIVTDLACTNSGHRTAVETLIERAREALAPEAVAGSATPTGDDDD